MPPNRYVYFALPPVSLLSACASSGVTPIGANPLRPFPPGSQPYVNTSEKEVASSFKVIGIVSYSNPGKCQVLSLADVIPDLKDLARKAGTNGMIIDETRTLKSAIIRTGIGVT